MELVKLWRILQTYLYRPRFWFSGGAYLLTTSNWSDPLGWEIRALTAMIIVAILGCFIGLHVRRQFGGPLAQMLPGFAVPHLVVVAAVLLVLCVAWPWFTAYRASQPPLPIIALHMVGALFAGLVAAWARAGVLVVTVPAWVIWMWTNQFDLSRSWSRLFLQGNYPDEAWALVAAAVAVQPVAAYRLLKLGDRDISVSDDLTIDELPRGGAGGRWEQRFLASRDATAERRLSLGKQAWFWNIERWRIPVGSGWAQWILPALAVWGFMLMVGLVNVAGRPSIERRASDYPLFMLVTAAGAMLFAPYGRWHARRAALAAESVRPVSRRNFVGEMSAALAVDVALWTALVSLIFVVGTVGVDLAQPWRFKDGAFFDFLLASLVVLWGLAVLLYGIGLLVLRYRYWVPLMMGGLLAWMITVWPVFMMLIYVLESSARHPRRAMIGPEVVFVFFLLTAGSGLLLARWAKRRWVEADFV